MDIRLAVSVLSLLLLATGCGVFSDWEQSSPGTVVIHSDTEVSFTSNWTCNPQRVRPNRSGLQELKITFEIHNDDALKMCAIGDCGVIETRDGAQGDIDPAACQDRYQLPEPLGDRQLLVNDQPVEAIDNR